MAPRCNIYRITISEYRRLGFVGKAPCAKTLKRMVDDGELPGERRGNTYWILVDEHAQPVDVNAANDATHRTGNVEVDALLREWEQTRA